MLVYGIVLMVAGLGVLIRLRRSLWPGVGWHRRTRRLWRRATRTARGAGPDPGAIAAGPAVAPVGWDGFDQHPAPYGPALAAPPNGWSDSPDPTDTSAFAAWPEYAPPPRPASRGTVYSSSQYAD